MPNEAISGKSVTPYSIAHVANGCTLKFGIKKLDGHFKLVHKLFTVDSCLPVYYQLLLKSDHRFMM